MTMLIRVFPCPFCSKDEKECTCCMPEAPPGKGGLPWRR